MDPITGLTAIVGAGAVVTGMYKSIKEARAESKEQKLKTLAAEIQANADSDRRLLDLVKEGKCDGIADAKRFRKLMKEVFKRHPDQEAILGKKAEKCFEIAKRSRR